MLSNSRFFRISLILILVLFAAFPAAAEDYNALVVEVLEGYQELMSITLDSDVEDNPGQSWAIVREAISRGFLRFTADPTPKPYLFGARFHAVPGADVTYIYLSESLLDAWEAYPSTVFSVLTQAINEAAGFFMGPDEWGIAKNDTMDNLFIQYNNYRCQAELIRDRLLPMGYLLSAYDAYVLDSFEKDELISFTMFMNRHSVPVAQGLYTARLAFEANGDENSFRKVILDLGSELLDARNRLDDNPEDQAVYSIAVAIHSWLEFTPVMISRIHNRDRSENPLSFPEVLEKEDEYADLRRLLEASRTRDMPIIEHVYGETQKGFEEE